MSSCPKCGKAIDAAARICPACGVIVSKVRAKTGDATMAPGPVSPRPGRPLPPSLSLPPPARTPDRGTASSAAPAPSMEDDAPSPHQAMMKVGLAAAAALVAMMVLGRMRPAPVATATPPVSPARVVSAPARPALEAANHQESSSLTREDVAFLNELSARLAASPGSAPTDSELDRVERLQAANRGSDPLRKLLMNIYLRRADHDLGLGSFAQVDQTVERARRLDDGQADIFFFEAQARAGQNDWAGAVAAAQGYEAASGDATVGMSYLLALALEKVGRRPDAVAVLSRPIFQSCASPATSADGSACVAAQTLREALASAGSSPPGAGSRAASAERPREALNVDASKQQVQSDRFDVRFDGESQSGVARDVLFVLDRAYTRLTDIYYDQPHRKIQVVLHAGEDYYTKTGAPWWSGGAYSSHNGAIQIPIRGLPATLPREMEDVLVHELSHAFVDDMSGGFAGRDLQEGLAQYMEGKRIEQVLGLAELKRLAHSGGQSVGNFYMISLAISEQLVQSRGQGMINQLLKAMKDTHSEDGGFKKVFGQSGEAMKRDVLETFWRRYS